MITVTELRDILSYNSLTGHFVWRKKTCRKVVIGARAGSLWRSTGYRAITINGSRYFEHRLAWFYMTGEWPPHLVDHVNQARDDNRFSNLRLATHSQNRVNSKIRKDSRSGVKGVRHKNGRWLSCVSYGRQRRHLGSFASREEAIAARRAAMPEALISFIPPGAI